MVFVFLPSTLYIIIDLRMNTFGKLMLYARALGMFIPTCIGFPLYVSNLKFFINQITKCRKLTKIEKFIVFWAFFMWAAKLLHALAQTFIVTI